MRFVEPGELTLPRVYFTEFDRVTYSQYEMDIEDLRVCMKDLERKMKLLALIKGHVAIAASHLIESELAQWFVVEHPVLLKEAVIVPALRSEYRDFGKFVESKRSEAHTKAEAELYRDDRFSVQQGYPTPSQVAECLAENSALVLSWDVERTSAHFKRQLLADLNDQKSVLRFNLRGTDSKTIDFLLKTIEPIDRLSRQEVCSIANRTGDEQVQALLPKYADFVYYLAGATAVGCEGFLPQENLIDFSFTDLVTRKTHLSEQEIFQRIFIDLVESMVHKFLPVDTLDRLSFEEVIALRKSLLGRSFVEKYNRVMELAKKSATPSTDDSAHLVYDLQELHAIEVELEAQFRQCIEAEVARRGELETTKNGFQVLVSLASLVSAYGMVESVYKVVVNTMSYFGLGQYLDRFDRTVSRRLRELELFVDTSPQLQKPIFLAFLSEVSKEYKRKTM